MNIRSVYVLLVALAAYAATAQSPQASKPVVDNGHSTGAVHRDISESSALASAVISTVRNPATVGDGVKIHVVIQNRSDRDIELADSIVVFDARDGNGALPPETYLGCLAHYFSPCYKTAKPTVHAGAQLQGPTLPLPTIAAQQSLAWDQALGAQYDLSHPGTYTVVGYVHILDDGGQDAGTFKTNKIKVTVQ